MSFANTNDDFSAAFLRHRDDSAANAAEEELFVDKPEEREAILVAEASVGGVLKDVSRGLTEAPGQIVRGAQGAVQETLDMVLSAGDWLEKKFPITPGYEPPKEGEPETRLQIPELVGPADSTTGGIVKDVTQFLTGFVGAGKLKLLKNLQPTTKIGKAGKTALQGALSDFTAMDPHEDKLADLIEKYPKLSNPVTAFLAAKEGDNEAVLRLKRAAEGAGLGVVVDGFVMAASAIRSARRARAQARIVDPEVPAPKLRLEQTMVLGDPKGKLVRRVEEKVAEGAEKTKGLKPKDVGSTTAEMAEKPGVYINFARIDAPEDVQGAMKQMADWFKSDIDEARRGVRTHEQTKLSAQQVNAFETLMTRRTGEPLNAEQSLAARELWASSGAKLSEVAQLAAREPSEANLVSFRKMLATHYAIQKEVISARTETARALNAWRIPAGTPDMMLRRMETLLEENGGPEVARKLAQRVAALSEAGMTREVEQLVEGTVYAKSRDAVAQVWINSLLSNPATHVVNAVSNWSVIAQQIGERRVAAWISEVTGTPDGVAAGEALAQMGAVVSGFKDAMRASWKTLQTGQSHWGLMKGEETVRPGALSADAWGVASDTWLGKSLDLVNTTTQVPGRALATADEFFKSIGYRMELHAQAARMAKSELDAGAITPADLKRRTGEIIAAPPENIQLEAVDAALYQTFTQRPAEVLKRVADAVQNVPVLGVLVMPFKNTPINLLTYAAERSPMAPLVKEWRDDMLAGGARADLAMARMGTGSLLLLSMVDAALEGHITGKGPTRGPERQHWMREGNQEYSVRVGDRYFSFSRVDPIGMTIGMAADIAGAIVNADKAIDQSGETYKAMEEAVIAAQFAIAKNVMSKTYMSGVAQFFDALSDPDRYGERWVERLAGTVVPAGVANVARQVDPYMRSAQTVVEAMQKRTPFFSEDLPMYRDLWGRPVDYRSGFGTAYDMLSPVYTRKFAPEPIDAEMGRVEYFPTMPEKKVNFNGVVVNLEDYPHAYERYVELAGNEVKHPAWDMGAKDFLNAVVQDKHAMSEVYRLYSDGPNGGKAEFIKNTLAEYRKLARDQVLAEFYDVQAEYDVKRKQAPYGNKYDPALFGQ